MILYLLKFMISSVVLFAFYHFFLSREKTLVFNRFYLLTALIFSLLIPFVQLDFYNVPAIEIPVYAVNADITNAPDLPVVEQDKATSSSQGLSFFSVLAGLYFIITALMGIRFFADLARLITRICTCEKNSMAEGTLVLTEAPCLPYSFFRYIFVNKEAFEKGDIDPNILKHEATHGRQWHSADVLFIALVQVFFWFNPIVFLYKKAMQLNHEYLADAAVLAGGTNLYNYQKVLLQLISEQSSPALACSFYSSTKKRLLMMTAENQFTRAIKKQLFIIPVLTFLVISLGCEDETLQEIHPLESHVERISREKVITIQTGKTTASEIREMFGKPDTVDMDISNKFERWTYEEYDKNDRKINDFLRLRVVFNKDTNVITRYSLSMQASALRRILMPYDIKNLNGKNIQDIKDMYGAPTTLTIEKGREKWIYHSSISDLIVITDQKTEKVKEYSYSYESSDQ